MQWIYDKAGPVSATHEQQARERQAELTKPPGSLGLLEDLAIRLAGLQHRERPWIERPAIRIYAADHGVAAEGVSAFPQEVTVQMIMNFANGGAAISVLARQLGADFQVINMGTAHAVPDHAMVRHAAVGRGTRNFCESAAMTQGQLEQSLETGKTIVDEVVQAGADLFIGGEMGIGNTTSAAALACALLDRPAADLVGAGTGVDGEGLRNKIATVDRALLLHRPASVDPVSILMCLGGFEIAALTGSYIRCAQQGLPALVDGFICGAAAMAALRINPAIRPWLFFAHQSAEQGHRLLLEALEVRPLLSLDMRLGEGSGAAVVLPLLQAACRLHNQMATFAEAGVSEG
ncbi:MAG TPA: nicotinate-nucleotide--dimethylbenzimidazole phosphoribosyltransferase [Gammaproteobacteria bacterium]|nr:nicotinate-nucleotide--dimethylbenzimidazole phosphoribosyltransferase [Gammaproteobacteria bacterium]